MSLHNHRSLCHLRHFLPTYPALTNFKFSRHMLQCKPSMPTLSLFGFIALTVSVAFLTLFAWCGAENISYLPSTINLANIMEESGTAAVHHPQTISCALSTVISCVCYAANDTMTRGHHKTVYDKLMADFDMFTPGEFAELLRDNIPEWMTKVKAELARPWIIAASPPRRRSRHCRCRRRRLWQWPCVALVCGGALWRCSATLCAEH